jgi:tRNA G46 methylase TrmB
MRIFYQKKDLFFWLAKNQKDWLEFPEKWVFTKYQQKAIKEGRKNIFLEFMKC